ncbi:mannosyl-oligosaccharide 1,2-alpha-mannosidase MNS1 [Echria macrotheca]|uniref:alpha-1,2-Mannosidase n=1 Tax=Echria macrotheca TaxID=438768 RepID=A0AAJ0BN16_9PEZI|nr:mannosyl-oligosaccharide 1,2-alpha-mannosidase MNS1 [Echria macrotheca]
MRLRRYHILASIGALCLVYYYLSRSSRFSSSPPSGIDASSEAEWLSHFMNDDTRSTSRLKSNSSFDWSKVKPRYPPGNIRALPSAPARPLPRVQHAFGAEDHHAAEVRKRRRQAVRDLFRKNWKSYRKYAWKKDALQPLSATSKDQFCGWAATLVDSLDTLWLMGLKAEFDEAVAAVADIDFGTTTSSRVNMFETNIRYLGGLLAAYDLSKRPILLQKATELGDLLYAGFDTVHRMPVDFIDFSAAKRGDGLDVEGIVVSASPGTLSLEMTRLSQLTGDPKYYDAVARVMDLFAQGQEETALPGLWPMFVSMSNRDVVTGNQFTIAGNADSLYEYLPKMHALLGGAVDQYKTMSELFMAAADKHLFFRPMVPGDDDILVSGNTDIDAGTKNAHLDPEVNHLSCFIGGIFALGGRLLGREDHVETGAKLARGCAYAYRAMPTGMGPERWNMVACASRDKCSWDEAEWERERRKRPEYREHLPKGFTTAKDPRYILRPEAIESVFVLYRVTGRKEFQDVAWDMFVAISNGTATEYANAAVMDVTVGEYPLRQEDYMESFWLAETLKYFYLVFSPPDLLSLDDWVLNTEAHPFRRPH